MDTILGILYFIGAAILIGIIGTLPQDTQTFLIVPFWIAVGVFCYYKFFKNDTGADLMKKEQVEQNQDHWKYL